MADLSTKTRITVDDLLGQWVEVVDGEVIELSPTGFLHNIVVKNILFLLEAFVNQHKLGYVGTDGLIFLLHVDDNAGVRYTRVPDVSFIRRGRFSDFDLSRPFPGAPDLAVEVASPSESEGTVLSKIDSYFTYGTEQVWIAYPDVPVVHQYTDASTIKIYRPGDQLTAESLLPGFKVDVAEFFALPDLD